MDGERRLHLEELRRSHQRRLRVLERRAATSGLSTPPEVLTEIEDIQNKIAKIDIDLERDIPLEEHPDDDMRPTKDKSVPVSPRPLDVANTGDLHHAIKDIDVLISAIHNNKLQITINQTKQIIRNAISKGSVFFNEGFFWIAPIFTSTQQKASQFF